MKSWEKAIMAHDKNCEVAELMNEFKFIFNKKIIFSKKI